MPHRRAARRVIRFLATRPPLTVVQHPFEVFISVMCVTGGVPLLLGQVAPGTINALLPPTLVIVWGLSLTLGGAMTSMGVVLFRHRIERMGLSMLSAATFVYAVAIAARLRSDGLVAALVFLGFSGACLQRVAALVEMRAVIRREAERNWGL